MVDIATIASASNGLKMVKEVFVGLLKMKIQNEYTSKINEAMKRVGEAQDALFQLREELFSLQSDNENLKKEIAKRVLHILQDMRNTTGNFRCTGCGNEFPINPPKKRPPSEYSASGIA
ncbi:MAG: hypothetical protein E3K36_16880 [Candidatus Brocadia sp.]|nr:hypothetical protein [Candidatus Brocadia sp.]